MTACVIVCAGGHGRVLVGVLRRSGIVIDAWVDAAASLHGAVIDDITIEDEATILERAPNAIRLVNGRGNIPREGRSGLSARRDLYQGYADLGFRFATVVSINAVVAGSAKLGEGCQVITGAIVHPGATVGVNTIVNTGAQIDHDCQVGAHVHIAPGAILCGWVSVGDEAHVGAGAVISDHVTIGEGAIVGAGAVVLRDVAAGTTVVGNPARIMRDF